MCGCLTKRLPFPFNMAIKHHDNRFDRVVGTSTHSTNFLRKSCDIPLSKQDYICGIVEISYT
jgi:hypothetical protein